MTWAVYLNETPLDSIGVYVEAIEPRWAGPSRDYPVLPLPGRQGVLLAADPMTGSRTLALTLSIDPAARTVAALVSATDQLKALAYRALIKVVADDDVTAPRQIDGVCTACSITPVAHPMTTQVARASLTILCPDPTWYDVVGQMIGFNATASPIPLGTSPSGGLVRIAVPSWSANLTGPTLVYKSAAGVTLQTLGLTGSTWFAGTDYIEIDLDRQTIVSVQSGVSSNSISLLTTGGFFVLDPMDGDPLNASYPTLSLTASTGTPSGQWLGNKRWL